MTALAFRPRFNGDHMAFCPACGAEVAENLQFCPRCGANQQGPLPGATTPAFGIPAVNPVPSPAPFVPPPTVEVTIGRWISEGWNAVSSDIGMFIVCALVYVAVISAVPFVLHGAMAAGFFIACIRKLLYGRLDVGDLFKGFNFFVPTLVVALLVGLFSFIGFIACIIPGIVVAAIYLFPYLFVIDKGMDFWPAMQASHEVVKRNYFGFTMFILALFLVNLLGFLCLIVGVVITIPITFMAITIAYRDLVGFNPNQTY